MIINNFNIYLYLTQYIYLQESEVPLKSDKLEQQPITPEVEKPTLKDFVVSVKRIMKNKLFLFNTFSGVFYILGSAPFIYFIGKYLEVQYGTSSGGGTIIAGKEKIITIFSFEIIHLKVIL